MTVPSDIRDLVKRKYTKKIVLCALAEIVIITYLCLFGERTFSAFDTFSYVLIHILLVLAPLAYFNIPKLIFDRSWRGTVTRVWITTSRDNEYPYKNTWEGVFTKNNVFLYVDEGNGRIVRRKAYAGKAKQARFINTYQVGDVVTHVAGTDYVQIMPKRASDSVICVVCSATGSTDETHCKSCRHTLLIP